MKVEVLLAGRTDGRTDVMCVCVCVCVGELQQLVKSLVSMKQLDRPDNRSAT